MSNNKLYGLIILLLIGCKSEKNVNSFSGEFSGYWASTEWRYTFYPNNEFEFKSSGHYGFVESKGTYQKIQDTLFLIPMDSNLVNDGVVNSLFLIDGDSCIIDYQLKYDYCKTRDWSKQREIKYPQIKTKDLKLKREFEFMFQNALESEEIKKQIKDTSKNLIIEEYYELDNRYRNQLKVFGKAVIFKTKEEIKSEQIENYIQVDDINFNEDFTSIYLNIIPIIPGEKILAYYNKNGKK